MVECERVAGHTIKKNHIHPDILHSCSSYSCNTSLSDGLMIFSSISCFSSQACMGYGGKIFY